ncbi:AfaD family invasin [Aeromonas salmonicida]
MSYVKSVNSIMASPLSFFSILLFMGFFFLSSVVSANDHSSVIQLSIPPFEGRYLKDGHLIGRGRVVCVSKHNRFRALMGLEYLGPDRQSYILHQTESRQATLNVRLQGYGWQTLNSAEDGIIKISSESSEEFEIVAHGEQYITPGSYPLRVNAQCYI